MALLKDVNLTKQLDRTLLKPYVGSRRDYLDIVYISLTSTAMSVDHDSIRKYSTTFTYVKLQCGNYFLLRKKRSNKTDERICVTSIPQGSSVRLDDLFSQFQVQLFSTEFMIGVPKRRRRLS